jgi:hypothetical protein
MALFNELSQAFVKFNGGQLAPAGSFLNPRTMCVIQNASDTALLNVGTCFQITTSNGSSLSACATAINTGIGTSYTSANLHTYTSADLIGYPGIGAYDA